MFDDVGSCLECGNHILGGYPQDGNEDRRICGTCAGISVSPESAAVNLRTFQAEAERWARIVDRQQRKT